MYESIFNSRFKSGYGITLLGLHTLWHKKAVCQIKLHITKKGNSPLFIGAITIWENRSWNIQDSTDIQLDWDRRKGSWSYCLRNWSKKSLASLTIKEVIWCPIPGSANICITVELCIRVCIFQSYNQLDMFGSYYMSATWILNPYLKVFGTMCSFISFLGLWNGNI